MKQYTVDFEQGTVSGSKEQIEAIADVFGVDLHFSETNDEFVLTEEMHDAHLENAILKEVNDKHFENVWQLAEIFEGSLYKEWQKRVLDDEEEQCNTAHSAYYDSLKA